MCGDTFSWHWKLLTLQKNLCPEWSSLLPSARGDGAEWQPAGEGEDDAQGAAIESGLSSACRALAHIYTPLSCSVGGRESGLGYLQAMDSRHLPETVYIAG